MSRWSKVAPRPRADLAGRLAATKLRVIFRHFMDVRHAPLPLQYLTDAWLILSVGSLIAVYLVG